MKNILKYSSLIMLAVLLLISLVGCGNSTIIATMEETETNIGDYKARVEVFFEGDAISTVKVALTFEDEKIANLAMSQESEASVQFQKEGNTISTEMTAEEYKQVYGDDLSKMSKEEIIQQFKDEGYTVVEE